VIGLVKAEGGGSVDAEQARPAIRFIEPAEIDEQAHDAVSEPVMHRPHSRVHDLAVVEHDGR
jgi:hypothetical protein